MSDGLGKIRFADKTDIFTDFGFFSGKKLIKWIKQNFIFLLQIMQNWAIFEKRKKNLKNGIRPLKNGIKPLKNGIKPVKNGDHRLCKKSQQTQETACSGLLFFFNYP